MRRRVLASLSQLVRRPYHIAPPASIARPQVVTPTWTYFQRQNRANVSTIPLTDDEQDAWIREQEKEKLLALTTRIRSKSRLLKNMKTFANQVCKEKAKDLSRKDYGKLEELVRRIDSEGVHLQTVVAQLADLMGISSDELARISADGEYGIPQTQVPNPSTDVSDRESTSGSDATLKADNVAEDVTPNIENDTPISSDKPLNA